MMLKSKITIAGMTVAVVLAICYIIYATGGSAPAADDTKGWAKLILVFIGVSIVAQIVTQIISHMLFAVSLAVKEGCDDAKKIERTIRSETIEDERDEHITFRSSHIGYACAGAGFILMLIVLVFFDISAALLLNMLVMAFFISAMIGSAVSIYLYERGDKGWEC